MNTEKCQQAEWGTNTNITVFTFFDIVAARLKLNPDSISVKRTGNAHE